MERDWTAIRDYYEAGHSASECRARFGLTEWEWHSAIGRREIVPRRGTRPVQPSDRHRLIVSLIAQGCSYGEIAGRLGVSKGTVAYHARRAGREVNDKCARRYDWKAVQRAVDAGRSRLECIEEFGFSPYAWNQAVKRGDLEPPSFVIPLDDLLVIGRRTSRGHLKQRLRDAGLKGDACEECGISEWRGRGLSLALHHVNGVGDDNRLENLQLLCPNCHSQTPNYSGRNRGGSGA